MENQLRKDLGYTKKLCILPFDHRSFFTELFGFHEPLNEEQKGQLSEYKKVIYAGYEKSLGMGVSNEISAILVDDVFGMDILMDAKAKGYTILQSTEISGIDHFEFEHGDDWQAWIEKVGPTFTKVLVRYNPDGDKVLNEKTLANLKKLSDYSHEKGYKYLIEALVPATPSQLEQFGNDKSRYDHELRPDLTVRMIAEMQNYSIEPDVWKIEGMYTESDYEKVVSAARSNGDNVRLRETLRRDEVGIVSLGRNETDEVVELWLKTGVKVPGVVGFAVGRTIFLNALMKYREGACTKEQASQEIAERFLHFYKVFNEK